MLACGRHSSSSVPPKRYYAGLKAGCAQGFQPCLREHGRALRAGRPTRPRRLGADSLRPLAALGQMPSSCACSAPVLTRRPPRLAPLRTHLPDRSRGRGASTPTGLTAAGAALGCGPRKPCGSPMAHCLSWGPGSRFGRTACASLRVPPR
jgi:hypothetical protein